MEVVVVEGDLGFRWSDRDVQEVDEAHAHILRVCQATGAFIEYWGFKAVYGRIWTLLALRATPMSQIEVSRFFGVSRALVSTSLAKLTDYGLVRAVGGHRNAPYVAVLDVWPTISDVLRDREWMLLSDARSSLEAAVQFVDEAEKAGRRTSYSLSRMQRLLAMTSYAQMLLKVLMTMRMGRFVSVVGGRLRRARRWWAQR